MKKTIIIGILLVNALIALEKQKTGQHQLVEHEYNTADIEAGKAAYKEFKAYVPTYSIRAEEYASIFPKLFEFVPVNLQQAIADYAAYIYPSENTIISALSKLMYQEFPLRLLKWKALGYVFNLMPYYNYDQGYFYFEQPNFQDKNSVLKGVRKDKSVKALHQLDDIKKKLSNSRDPKKDQIINQVQHEWQEVAESLVQEYKIHLMPQGDLTQTIITLLNLLKADPELQQAIAAFKVMVTDKFFVNGVCYPRIVIYPAKGKENVQKALNKLYVGLKEIKGIGHVLSFDGKVNDLISIAQGDRAFKKKPEYHIYFEQPKMIYFRKDLTGKDQNYHLIHPETGKEIV